MSAIARVGVDVAGGLIQGGGQSSFYMDGYLVSVVGDKIAPHGHVNATMAEGSPDMFIEGKAVCRKGDRATCNHTITTGSSDAFAD